MHFIKNSKRNKTRLMSMHGYLKLITFVDLWQTQLRLYGWTGNRYIELSDGAACEFFRSVGQGRGRGQSLGPWVRVHGSGLSVRLRVRFER